MDCSICLKECMTPVQLACGHIVDLDCYLEVCCKTDTEPKCPIDNKIIKSTELHHNIQHNEEYVKIYAKPIYLNYMTELLVNKKCTIDRLNKLFKYGHLLNDGKYNKDVIKENMWDEPIVSTCGDMLLRSQSTVNDLVDRDTNFIHYGPSRFGRGKLVTYNLSSPSSPWAVCLDVQV